VAAGQRTGSIIALSVRPLLGLLAIAVLGGRSSIGAVTLPRDRFDYSSALSESWKYQTLQNVVKLRYMDIPIFVDVAQVVSAYQLETQVNVGASVRAGSSLFGDLVNAGVAGRYTDRPTISYTPLTGDQYLRGIMTPSARRASFPPSSRAGPSMPSCSPASTPSTGSPTSASAGATSRRATRGSFAWSPCSASFKRGAPSASVCGDLLTKRNFAFLLLLFSLAETGSKQPLPIITIPAQ
jgi:hypothetical protein